MLSTACDSASIISVLSKWLPLSFICNQGNRETWGVWRQQSCFWPKIQCLKKGKCEEVRCRDKTASYFVANVRGEVLEHFLSVAANVTSICRNDSLDCQDKFFVRNPFDVEENDERFLDSVLPPSSLLLSSMSLDSQCASHVFIPEILSNHCRGLRLTFSEICTKFDAVPLSYPSRILIWPDTPPQINGRETSIFTQLRVTLYTYSQDILSTTFYLCTVLLQLLYKWEASPGN
jgi:hypothetical protein